MTEVLRAEQIEKYYGTKENLKKALDGLSFQVEEGEFTGIMGASGHHCGGTGGTGKIPQGKSGVCGAGF